MVSAALLLGLLSDSIAGEATCAVILCRAFPGNMPSDIKRMSWSDIKARRNLTCAISDIGLLVDVAGMSVCIGISVVGTVAI